MGGRLRERGALLYPVRPGAPGGGIRGRMGPRAGPRGGFGLDPGLRVACPFRAGARRPHRLERSGPGQDSLSPPPPVSPAIPPPPGWIHSWNSTVDLGTTPFHVITFPARYCGEKSERPATAAGLPLGADKRPSLGTPA